MFSELLPADVIVEETDSFDDHEVLAEELAALQSASQRRTDEFATGRTCARRALRRLGIDSWPLLVGASREPLWPERVVGSISHTEGWCVAAVAVWPEGSAFGVDVERSADLPFGVCDRVLTPAEREWCEARQGSVPWDTVIFSAKEALYKAWFQITGEWLGYLDAELSVIAEREHRGRIRVEWLGSDTATIAPSSFDGRYVVTSEHVATAVTCGRKSFGSGSVS